MKAIAEILNDLSPREVLDMGLRVLARLGWALVFGVLIATLITSVAQAESARGLRLYSWKPYAESVALIIPVRAFETPKQAAVLYLEALRGDADLAKLFQKKPGTEGPEFHYPELALENFEILLKSKFEKQAVLLANRSNDYAPRPKRVVTFSENFLTSGRTTYLMPISADLRLSEPEATEFRNLVADTFSRMVAMGGHDVDPRFYKTKTRTSTWKTPTRDQSEIELIKTYVAKERGFLFGTCRGQQITAIALGYRLIQDIPSELGMKLSHKKDIHSVEVYKTTNSILLAATSGRKHAQVNSLHHQSVRFKAGGPLEVAARSADGVVEALEFKNGHGLLVQFHPELMSEDVFANRILARVAESVPVSPRGRTCEASFR